MSDTQGAGPHPVQPPPAAATPADGGDAAPSTAPDAPEAPVMDLLAEHVPLALLVDLLTPEGPASDDILRTEGMPDDAWWEPAGEVPPAEADGDSGRDSDDEAAAQP